MVDLAASVSNTTTVQALVYPSLLMLADKSRETVHLGIRKGFKLIYIGQINTPHRVQLETWLHQSYPLHVTAAGKVFLVYADDKLVHDYLAIPLVAFSSKSIIQPKQPKEELERIRTQDYAQTKQEFSEDINGFAVGIFDAEDKPMATISISGPSFRFPEKRGSRGN